MSNGRIYFGRVREVRQSSGEYRFATVEPLVRSSEDQGKWIGSVTRPEEEFPSRGLVFWHDAPEGLEEGSYWQFEVIEHPYYNGEERTEAYQISHPKPGIEVLDLRGRGSDSVVRRLVTQEGIRTEPFPLTPRVLIRTDKDSWIGPVELVRSRASRTWKIAPSENLAVLDCWRLADGSVDRVSLEGSRYLLGPRGELGTHAGYVNWMSDLDLASGLLKRLRKLDKGAAEALHQTYAVFDGYITALGRADLIGKELEQELGRKERVRELRSTIIRNKELLEDAVSALLETEAVRKELEERKELVYREIREEQEKKVETDLSSRREQLCDVETAVEAQKQELSRLTSAIQDQRQELDRTVESFRTELIERVGRLTEIPEKAFAELAVLKALLPSNGPDTHTVTAPSAVVHRGRTSGRENSASGNAVRLGEMSEVFQGLTARLAAGGLSPHVGMHLHVAFLAGAVPILTGAKAYDALQAYAATAAAGRLLWVPVSGTTYEPQDLLGRFDSASRRIIPHPGGVLDSLTRRDGDELSVIVLEGFNRAPAESYLLPVLDCHADAVVGSGGRAIPLVAGGLVDPEDPYAGVNRVAWRPNVLMACVPVNGMAVLPVPSAVWRHAVLIDTDRYRSKGTTLPSAPAGAHTSLLPDRWAEWRSSTRELRTEPMAQILDTVADRVSDGVHDVQQLALRLYAAATTCGLPKEFAVALVFEILLLPLLHEEVDEVARYMGEAAIKVEDSAGIAESARRIIE